VSIETYVVGQLVRWKAHFTDEEGEDVDPVEVTLFLNPPTEIEFSLTLSGGEVVPGVATGDFSALADVNEEGDWNYRWETEDPVCVAQGVIQVMERNVA